jgi:glycosyltransferase involved in cell wall biosynthesis
MRKLGHECDEICGNLETLQKTWAGENGISFSTHNWRQDILFEQIVEYKPEVLVFQNDLSFPHWAAKRLKEWIPSLKKIVVINGFPHERNLEHIDLILGASPSIRDFYRDLGLNSELLYYSFDEKILDKINSLQDFGITPKKPCDASFIGYSGYGGHGNKHEQRYQLLLRLLRETDLKGWISENPSRRNNLLPSDSKTILELFPDKCKPGVTGIEMYDVIRNSNVTLNKHTFIEGFPDVGNMRMFESTGMGTCLLTDSKDNISDLFNPDDEVVTYSSDEECIQKLNYLIDNPKMAKEIGYRGQKRTEKVHSLESRCKIIDHHLRNLFN